MMNTVKFLKHYTSAALSIVVILMCGVVYEYVSIKSSVTNEVHERILRNINTARHVLAAKQDELLGTLTGIVLENPAPSALQGTDGFREYLERLAAVYPFEVLAVFDREGRILASHGPGGISSDNYTVSYGCVSVSLASGQPASDIEPVVIRPLTAGDERNDLMISACIPLRDQQGEIHGILAGGRWLTSMSAPSAHGVNGEIASVLFSDGQERDGNTGLLEFSGTDPLYLKKIAGGNANPGQRMIKMIRNGVRYIVGYEYLSNRSGRVVGTIAVGIREDIIKDRVRREWYRVGGITVFCVIAAVSLIFSLGRKHLSSSGGAVPSEKSNRTGDTRGIETDNPRDLDYQELCRRLSESKRLATLGQLAAGVAHEINNPLTGVIVYSHLLLEDTDEADPRYENISKIIRESHRCKHIIKSLLDFARQSQPFLESVDINFMIMEALNNLIHEPAFEHVEIIKDLGVDLPQVYADSSQIQQVFGNIIRNAMEVMDGSGRLFITSRAVRDDDGTMVIEVLFEDTGPGILPEHIDHIFDPFFTTKTKGHGTGLGLAVSYGIVERHSGSISVRNSDSGGAVFAIRLPLEGKRHD